MIAWGWLLLAAGGGLLVGLGAGLGLLAWYAQRANPFRYL